MSDNKDMERYKPGLKEQVIKAARAVSRPGVVLLAGTVGYLATRDGNPAIPNNPTEVSSNGGSKYTQSGESLGTMPLEDAVNKVVEATAKKAEAGGIQRFFIPLIPDPEINQSSLIGTPGPRPSPTETPVSRRTLEQYLQTAIENTASRLSKDGHDVRIFEDPNASDKASFLDDPLLRQQAIDLLAEDAADTSGGTFDDLYSAGFTSLASAPTEFNLQPYTYAEVEDGREYAVPIGRFGVAEASIDGRIVRVLGRVWSGVPQDPKEAEVYRRGQLIAISRYLSCLSIAGRMCDIGPAMTPAQLNKMRTELNVLRALHRIG
jgi:hypothetical protein